MLALAFDLDGSGQTELATGVPFFDHMLHALANTAASISPCAAPAMPRWILTTQWRGCRDRARRGDQAGTRAESGHRPLRSLRPLDEALARVVIDCSGRPYLEFIAAMPEPVIGVDFAASLVEEFWRALVRSTRPGLTCHIDLIRARNSHHAAEAIFQAGALALRAATRRPAPPRCHRQGMLA